MGPRFVQIYGQGETPMVVRSAQSSGRLGQELVRSEKGTLR